ncbi:MAG: TonB-dependent receptor [Candidatus Sulfopaludibacter sp.]|nr:TonB-dependent receptor [Candidatus Sulfopaludibacter sp.]
MKRFLIAMLLAAASMFAQVNVTAVTGLVTDPSGAAVPAATVEALAMSTSQVVRTTTNEKGEYTIPSLPAGTYKITVSKDGFRTGAVQNVELIVGVPGTVNVKLEIGQATETVEVTAGAEVVQATTADVSTNLTGRQLTDLPFATRNAIELLVDVPGTSTPTTPRSSSVNGLPKGALNVTIDGMNTQDNMLKSSDGYFSYIMPSIDSLEEVTMSTSAVGVDSTSQGGAQIKFVTRSGTNQWHGGGFWQDRNTAFNANYFYNQQAGLPRDIIKLNQEGGHIGGPIKKNKLFFFGNVEVYRFPGTNLYSRTYLTPSASSGIFTYANGAGQQQQVNMLQLAQGVNGNLPSSVRPYPTSADPRLAKTYGLMQQLGANGIVKNNQSASDYNTLTTSYQPTGTDSRDFFTSRIDYNISQKNTFSFVYNYDWYASVPDFLNGIVPDFPGSGTVLFSPVSTGQRSNRFDGTVSLRSALSPTLTNEFRAGLNGGTVLFFDLVSPGMFSPWGGFVPSFANPGTGLSGVATTSGPQRRNAPVKNFGDTVSWVKGTHQFSFGGNWDQINVYQQIEGSALFPGISFGIASGDPITTGSTNMFTTANFPGANTTQLSQAANLYADVTGRVSNISQQLALSEATHQYSAAAPIDRDQIREFGLFAQDQWRAMTNLTITLGLRVEKQGALQNLNGLYSNVSYAGLFGVSGPGNLFNPGALNGSAPVYTQLNGSNSYNPPPVWAPSVGLAYELPAAEGVLGWLTGHHSGASVFRAGYSLATVREGMNVFTSLYGGNQGLTVDDSVSPTTYPAIFGAPGSVSFGDPTLPSRTSTISPTPSYPIPSCSGCSVSGVDPNLKMGYVQSWNFSFQRELDRNTVVDFRYTGNHGVDLWRRINLNEVNIVNNGFLTEFQAAQNNLAIARGGNINQNTGVTNFGNQGLPGQQAIPIIQTAIGNTTDATTAGYLQLGQAGSSANSIATNAARMAALTKVNYPINMFQVNPLNGGAANLLTNDGFSNFNAFQVEVRRRLAGGFTINGSYQFAKALQEGEPSSSIDLSSPTTLRNLGLDRTPSSFDIRHDIKFNWIYELPFGPGRAFGASTRNPFVKRMIGGWQISGVVRLQSGTPNFFGGLDSFNNNSSGVIMHNMNASQFQSMVGVYKTSYPSANGGLIYYLPPPSQAPNGAYFATLNSANNTNVITNTMAAFNEGGLTPAQVNPSAPYIGPAPAGQMGWNGYYYLPWQRHFDLSLQKNTRLTERIELQIGAHALDLLNVTNFLPGGNTTATTFGQITSAYRDISGTVDPGSRIIEFVVRLNF